MALSPVRLRASINVGSADTIAFTRSNSPALIASMKAAALSVMGRFYLAILWCLVSASAAAQTPISFEDRPPLGAEITVGPIGNLPSSDNLFALFDTIVPDIIADRIEAGGTAAAAPSRVGAHGSTWTQTSYRVGDADITDPALIGLPLLMPGVDAWEHVEAATGLMPIDLNAPGMAVTLTPRHSANDWARSVELSVSGPAINAGSSTADPPAIQRLNSWGHANLFLAGPAFASAPARLGVLVSATYNRATYFDRNSADAVKADLVSGFLNLTTTTGRGDQLRLIGWAQHFRDAAPHYQLFRDPNAGQGQTALHTQLAWQRPIASGEGGLRAYGAFTTGHRSTDLVPPASVAMERLRDGPVPSMLDPGVGTDRTWSIGARLNRVFNESRHRTVVGADGSGSAATMQSAFAGRVLELLAGLPERVWVFTDPSAESAWSGYTVNLFAGDTMSVSRRLTLDGGIRFEMLGGSAASHPGSVSWRTALPRAGFHVGLLDWWKIAGFGQYARYAHRLPLTDLAYGDPTAPTADIYRARPTATAQTIQGPLAALGPLVQKLGPGSNGDPTFSAIDPNLRRPYLDEAILGFEARPHPAFFFRIAAIGRREHAIVNVVDVGVPESSYTVISVPDMGIDVVGSGDDQTLRFYNRSPAAFGADRYLLTNPPGDDGSYVGVDILTQLRAGRTTLLLGATAGRSEGIAANRGFGPLENDTSVFGEAYVNPNALDHAQGRVFTERGYTLKLGATHQFDRDLMVGINARYQDGQHFARMVILRGLNQGAEAVRAFRNGRTRFSFTSTLDVRLQKGFMIRGQRIIGILEAYNLLNEYFEYEEDTVSGPTSRQRTAVQPPFAMHIGVRIPF